MSYTQQESSPLKDHTGSSYIAIKKTVQASMPKDNKWMNATFLAALKKMVADGTLVQNNASYKLSPEKKEEETAPPEERVPMLGEDQSASSSSIPKPVSRHGRKKGWLMMHERSIQKLYEWTIFTIAMTDVNGIYYQFNDITTNFTLRNLNWN